MKTRLLPTFFTLWLIALMLSAQAQTKGTVTDIDGNVYPVITIGDQNWLGKNLQVSKYKNGDVIDNVTDATAWSSLTTGAWVNFDNNSANDAVFGKLYNYFTVADERGLCPEGWHVPNETEWSTLMTYLGGSSVAGGKLKEIGTTNWSAPNTGATNETNFTALPTGYRSYISGAEFYSQKTVTYFWSADEEYFYNSYRHGLSYDATTLSTYSDDKNFGYAVRCIRDSETSATLPTVTTTAISAIAQTTATSGGNVSSDGGADVTARGVCWNTAANPTIANSKTSDGTGIGTFTSSLSGLTANTTYYVRAYATNSEGTAYGNEISFTTLPEAGTQEYASLPFNENFDGVWINKDDTRDVPSIYWKNTPATGNNSWRRFDDGVASGAWSFDSGAYSPSGANSSANSARFHTYNSSNGQVGILELYVDFSSLAGEKELSFSYINPTGTDWLTIYVSTDGGNNYGTGIFHQLNAVDWEAKSINLGDLTSTQGVIKFETVSDWGTDDIGMDEISITSGSTPPVAAFSADATTGTAPLTVQFTDVSSGNPTSWSWDFNNDGTEDSNLQNPSYTFTNSGTYSVKLVVSNTAGTDEELKTDYIVVSQALTLPELTTSAVSSITKTTATSGGNISSNGGADVSARGVCWSTSANPTIDNSKTSDGTGIGIFTSSLSSLTANTTYYVRAYATNSKGTAYGNEISFTTLALTPPAAAFSADATTGTAPLTVQFTDASSGNPTSWSWDFNNDGTEDATIQNPSFTYTSAGTYSVKLTVTNADGSNDELKTEYIVVSEAAGCLSPDNYTMNFESDEDLSAWSFLDANNDDSFWGITSDKGIDGTACGTYSFNSANVANDWLFTPCFDMEAGKKYRVSFYYAVAGSTFPEKLALGFGPEADVSMSIVLDLGAITNTDFENSSFEVSITSTGSYHFGWKCYSDADMWNVYLDGVSVSLVNNSENVSANFTADVTEGLAPLTVKFTDQSTGNPTAWAWDFNNDGTFDSYEQNPTYTYTTSGTFSVKLVAATSTQENGITFSDYISVNPVGINDEANNVLFTLYPNPSNGMTYLMLNKYSGNLNIEVIDLAGKTVLKQSENYLAEAVIPIDLKATNTGIYFIKVSTDRGVSMKKLIIE